MMVGVTESGYDDDDDDVGVIVHGTPPVATANIILITPLGLSIILSFIIPPTDGSTGILLQLITIAFNGF